MLKAMEKLRGRPEKASRATRLSDHGISYTQSSRWQKLADIPAASPKVTRENSAS
jgi:hypothetical protein